ncbi:glycosyltransferase family 4 protein [Pseudoduganella namucuonensis]|uniref:Glycosyltransferase involved in cell wall bisynthesis n=1 Tax=Pseudoduganella namucuonensis TaxID=1035707 RepID=A0A1I7GEY5_9BURK|nr:glycosyltransferase family 4 protein [Pseudoduganella namucuonensis]SFU46973.1 Glycosyltransferase involved in cell wall bisynthesis [Pseudoduganella namucuonensis]
MKILYHHRTRSKDGQYVHIEEMINALRAQGHEVVIVAPPSAETEDFGSDAGLVAKLKRHLPGWFYELMELGYSLVAYRRLVAAVKRHKPDCLYERYNLFLPAGIWLARKYKLPMLLEINAPIMEERARYDGLSLTRLARWSQAYAWRNADVVLPVTRVLGDMVSAYGVDAKRIEVIPNGINLERFDGDLDTAAAKRALGLENYLVLGFTGFVRDWHGLDKVIAMIAADPPESRRHLLVVGDGPVRAALEQQARELGIEQRVRFTGVIGRDEVARYVAAFDIALQPAVVAYASPLKLFEYLALGKAIVGPDQPNIREILKEDHNAVLFDPGQPDGLARAVERLCLDAELRGKVARNARAAIGEQQLTWQANARRVVRLFEGLMRRA